MVFVGLALSCSGGVFHPVPCTAGGRGVVRREGGQLGGGLQRDRVIWQVTMFLCSVARWDVAGRKKGKGSLRIRVK